MSRMVTVREDYNIYTPRGTYVDEDTWAWVAAYQDGRLAGCFKTVADAFRYLGPAGLIPHTRLMRSTAFNAEMNVFAGMKLSIDEPESK